MLLEVILADGLGKLCWREVSREGVGKCVCDEPFRFC